MYLDKEYVFFSREKFKFSLNKAESRRVKPICDDRHFFLSDFNKNFRAASYWSKTNSPFFVLFYNAAYKSYSVFKLSSEFLTVYNFLKFLFINFCLG